MDDYPAGDPMPDPDVFQVQHKELVDFLFHSREMRQTAKSSFKQAAYAGGGALAGGFLLGPIGGMVGGICGSIIGFLQADNYDGALLTISKLDEPQKKALMTRVGQVLIAAGATAQNMNSPTAFRDTLISFAAQKTVREELWNACIQSLQT